MIPKIEQETVINISRNDNYASIWTSDTTMIRRFDRLSITNPDSYKVNRTETINREIVSKEYIVKPASLISFRKSKVSRSLSEEQRKTLRERAKANLHK